MKKYGLIGRKLGHSFSQGYFREKFKAENIKDAEYHLYELEDISKLPNLLSEELPVGLNVTMPYKESVLPYLDKLDDSAQKVGAVNVLSIKDQIVGYNTDYFGFLHSLSNWIESRDLKALILGTGGASKAVAASLDTLGIEFDQVSRSGQHLSYKDLYDKHLITEYKLIINTTPLGMYPDSESFPDLDYSLVNSSHYFYDLVYNPEPTTFMKMAKAMGARTKGGLEMLHLQAEKSWEIWNS